MFKQATKMKLRFPSRKGSLSTEDLWDLPLTSAKGTSLDNIAKFLYKSINNADEISFVGSKSTTDKIAELQLNIVKEVISDRIIERDAKKDEKENADKRELLRGLIARKKNEELEKLSPEELEKQLSELS